MKTSSRAPSPTPTAFSGISSYRTESHRAKDAPAVPRINYRKVFEVHYHELGKYLENYLEKAPPNSRSTARSKLTRLTVQQFHELSTDVYDELVRRKNENEVPFLPVREEFHPKRNQARQKLATLPVNRLQDLSGDVYYELARRFPEFKENPSDAGVSTTSNCTAPELPLNDLSQRNEPRMPGRAPSTRDEGAPVTLDSDRKSSQNAVQPEGEDRRNPGQFAGDVITTGVNWKIPSGSIYRRTKDRFKLQFNNLKYWP